MVNPDIKKKIINAADALATRGEKTTNDAVREEMGGGSLAHISPVMREWRTKNEQNTGVMLEMPGSIKTAIDRVGAEIWKTADAEARKKVEAVQTISKERINEVEAERDEALQEITALEQKNKELQTQLEQAQGQNKEIQTQLDRSNKELQETKSAVGIAKLKVTVEKDKVEDLNGRILANEEKNSVLQTELIELAKKMSEQEGKGKSKK